MSTRVQYLHDQNLQGSPTGRVITLASDFNPITREVKFGVAVCAPYKPSRTVVGTRELQCPDGITRTVNVYGSDGDVHSRKTGRELALSRMNNPTGESITKNLSGTLTVPAGVHPNDFLLAHLSAKAHQMSVRRAAGTRAWNNKVRGLQSDLVKIAGAVLGPQAAESLRVSVKVY